MPPLTNPNPSANQTTTDTAVPKSQWLTEHPDVVSWMQQNGINPDSATGAEYADALYHTGYITSPPSGTSLENGHIVADQPNWLLQNPWLIPIIGASAGLGLAAATGAPIVPGAAADAATAGSAGTSAGTATAAGGSGTGAALTTGQRLLGAAGSVAAGLGALGSGLTTGAATGANIGNQYGRNLIDLYGQENAATRNQLAESQYLNTQLPSALANQSVRGDTLSNARDVSLSGVPSGIPNIQVSGGLRPSMFSPTTRNLGILQSANALKTAQNPPTFTNPTPPNIPAPSIPGGGTQALLGVGIGGNILQRLLPFLNTTKPNVNPNTGDAGLGYEPLGQG